MTYDILDRVHGGPQNWRPFHEVFLERVIKIDAVQRERRLVTEPDDEARDFFDYGRIPGDIGKYLWPLDGVPEPFPQGIVIAGVKKDPMSAAMQRAWDAAWANFRTSIVAPLRNGDLAGMGSYSPTGERRQIFPAEWIGDRFCVDVRDGALFVKERRSLSKQWGSIVLQEVATPQASTHQDPSAYEMIRAILEKAFKGKGPKYDGIDLKDLEIAVLAGWEAECKSRKVEHLIGRPPKRFTIGRAIGRHRPH